MEGDAALCPLVVGAKSPGALAQSSGKTARSARCSGSSMMPLCARPGLARARLSPRLHLFLTRWGGYGAWNLAAK